MIGAEDQAGVPTEPGRLRVKIRTYPMQKSTIFGIKVSVGSTLLLFALVVLSYYVLGEGYREAIHNKVFIGAYTTVLSFLTALFTANTLLKNSKLSKQEAIDHLNRGWRVYAGIAAIFFFINFNQALMNGPIFTLFSILSIAAGSAAFFVLRARQ